MDTKREIREWWQETLLGQQIAAHPVFGSDIHVSVDGGVVTLSGSVEHADQIEDMEREVASLDLVDTVVNRLTVAEQRGEYRPQTVVALFPGKLAAELARQASDTWTFHDDDPALVYQRREQAESGLKRLIEAAHVPSSTLDEYLEAIDRGKALLVVRAPEDDTLRIISSLEGTNAEKIRTLPPEPDGESG